MIKNVYGYNQAVAVELKLDLIDLQILGYVHYKIFLSSTHSMEYKKEPYYQISYAELLEDLPIIEMQKRALALRFKKLVNKGLLKYFLNKEIGCHTFFRLNKCYFEQLIFSEDEV